MVMLKEHLHLVGGRRGLPLRSVLSWFLVALTQLPAWKRRGYGGLNPTIVPAFSQDPSTASESSRERSGNKGQRDWQSPALD